MSFRGRYPTKFRRTGNFRGQAFKERGRPFKRKYHADKDDQIEITHMPIRGRGRPVKRAKSYNAERGRGRPFKKHYSERGLRPPRSRGRFIRGRQSNFRGNRGRSFESSRNYDHNRSFDRHESPGDWPEENEFVEEEEYLDEYEEGDEYYDIEEDHVPFDRKLRSPLTIHRRFDDVEFDHRPDRSRERSRLRSPSLGRKSFSDERENSIGRRRSPVEPYRRSLERRRDSIDMRRSHSIERRDNFSGHRRSRSIVMEERFSEHQRSVSPNIRDRKEIRKRSIDNRHFERSLSPVRDSRSRERFLQDRDHERSATESSRRSIERQIAIEKERLQQILEQEKKIREKRSESSIERLLDDCKRSFDKNSKSHSISRSSSFDGREHSHVRHERSFERSLSPLDRSRTFEGMENITIECGRSLERSKSPFGRPKIYQRTDDFSPVRERSPFWRESQRQTSEIDSAMGRKSNSTDHYKRRYSSQTLSPDRFLDRASLSNNSPSRAFRMSPNFLEQRERSFLGIQKGPFLEDRKGLFLEEQERPFLEEPERCFPEDRDRHLLGNRKLHSGEDFTFSRHNSLDAQERSFERSLKCPQERLQQSPVPQPASYENREDHVERGMDLSPISETGSVGKDKCNNKSVEINITRTERPNSVDSMQKFLAELEDDDRSKSPSEQNRLIEKNSDVKNVDDSQRTDKCPSAIIAKENDQQKLSYYDFKFNYDSNLNKKSDEMSNENNRRDELFNAYDKSFLNKTFDDYNDLFQGRFEKSSKVKKKGAVPKTDTHFNPKTLNPLSKFGQTSELSIPPTAQNILNTPTCTQNFAKKYPEMPMSVKPNIIPLNINPVFPGGNVKPNITPVFPNQMMRPVPPFHQTPGTLPIFQPESFQQSVLLSNQRTHIFQQKECVGSTLGNRMVPQQVGQSPIDWELSNPVDFKKDQYIGQFQQNLPNNFKSSTFPTSFQSQHFPSNQNLGQIGSPQFQTVAKQIPSILNNQHSEDLFKRNASKPYPEKQRVPEKDWPSGDSRKKSYKPHKVKEVIVISDDEGHSKRYNKSGYDDDLVYKKDGIIFPSAKTVENYKNCSPSYDVLGKILKGFVIYFGIKENSELQKHPIEVLQESFISSDGFEALDVEDSREYNPPSEPKQVCELKWKGVLLARGEGRSRDDAQYVAGQALINALAKTCYTVQTKYGYYNNGRYPKFMLKHPEKSGYYRFVKRDEIIKTVSDSKKLLKSQGIPCGVDATHVNAVITYMDEFFRDKDNHCELIFGPSTGMEYTLTELQTIARHAGEQGLQYRWFRGTKKVKIQGTFLCVSRYFSPQALKRYLMTEMGDTVRYRLFPPQGPKIDLLTSDNVYSSNMIKTILPMIGSDGNIRTDFGTSVNEEEPAPSSQGRSNKWHPGSVNTSSLQHQYTSPQYQNPSPDPRFQSPSHPFDSNPPFQNPGNERFNQSFQGVRNPYYMPGGIKRNDPFEGGPDGK